MAIPMFWRLILSHIGILLLSGAASLYSIVQLGSLSGTARSALDTNRRMIAYQEALIDAFLSEVRYGGKYLITHTEGRHEQLRQFKKDFVDYLNLLKQLGDSDSIGFSLARIERFHDQYHELFDREAAYIRAKQNYAQTRYRQEHDKIVESTLKELDVLRAQLRTKLQEKLESIDHGARTARRIAIVTTLVVLILGALLSLKVSRAIGGPVSEPSSAQPPPVEDWMQVLNVTWISLVKLSRHMIQLQANRLNGFGLSVGAAWSRRSASWKNAAPRGKATDL
jgi:DNA-binding transcriptional MerR regulator